LGGHYGLSTGPDDPCIVSPVNFLSDEHPDEGGLPSNGGLPTTGGGILLFHIKPLTEDTIMSVFFPYLSSTNGVWIDIARKENSVVLRLLTGASVTEMALYGFFKPETLIPGAVEFYIRPYRLEVKLSVGDGYYPQSRIGSIDLFYPLSGEGRITLGGAAAMTPAAVPAPVQLPEPDFNVEFPLGDESDETIKIVSTAYIAATIWDEFAILLSAAPLIREEVLPEIIEPAAEEMVTEAEVSIEQHTSEQQISDHPVNEHPSNENPASEHQASGLTDDLVTEISVAETPETPADIQITDSLIQDDFGEEKNLIYNDDELEQAAE